MTTQTFETTNPTAVTNITPEDMDTYTTPVVRPPVPPGIYDLQVGDGERFKSGESEKSPGMFWVQVQPLIVQTDLEGVSTYIWGTFLSTRRSKTGRASIASYLLACGFKAQDIKDIIQQNTEDAWLQAILETANSFVSATLDWQARDQEAPRDAPWTERVPAKQYTDFPEDPETPGMRLPHFTLTDGRVLPAEAVVKWWNFK